MQFFSDSNLGGVYFSSSYMTMGVGMGGFEFCLDVGAGICRLLVIFTLGYSVVLCGLLCLASTFVCDVSLWEASCGVVFF